MELKPQAAWYGSPLTFDLISLTDTCTSLSPSSFASQLKKCLKQIHEKHLKTGAFNLGLDSTVLVFGQQEVGKRLGELAKVHF